jgi:hypothetical protein
MRSTSKWSRLRPSTIAAFALAVTAGSTSAAQPPELPNRHEAFLDSPDAALTLSFPAGWSAAPEGRNTLKLRGPERGVKRNVDETTEISIWLESRLDHADAVARLRDIAAQFDGEVRYREIGGWPALERSFEALLPQKVARGRQLPEEIFILHASTAIAAGSQVVRIEAKIPSNDRPAIGLAHSIGRRVEFYVPGDAEDSALEIETLRTRPRRHDASPPVTGEPETDLARLLATPPARSPTPGAVPISDVLGEEAAAAGAGLVQNLGNFGELEVAASTDARHVIVATNSRSYSTSNDGGATFTTGLGISPAYSANGDPSVGYGQSGNFYFGFIAFPDGDGSGTGDQVNGCTNPVWTSTDDGISFSHTGHASWCAQAAPTCFPDQEHIGVDSWNPSASNQDQIYNVWRNFGSPAQNCSAVVLSGLRMQLTCSTDGGATFNNGGPASIVTAGGAPQGTAPVLLDANGDYPRITVGQDGFVYIAYRDGNVIELDKYTSCQSGLIQVPGFPVTVFAAAPPLPCPVPGLDRCNDGNDLRSPTVAVDDRDPSHVFVSWATPNGAGNDDVLVADSTDGGGSFGVPVRLNNGFATRRFMPWVCSTCGEAFVGWYDRRAATFNDNSLTDYYRGRASRAGGTLAAGLEQRLTTVSDSHCMPSPGNWPCAPRSANDSEGCSAPLQPQLAGQCVDAAADVDGDGNPDNLPARCDFSDCGGANANINFGANPACQCGAVDSGSGQVQCATGSGCPKYGDYNGQACAAGRVFSSWASATPAGAGNGGIDSYFTSQNFCAPQITIPGDLDFGTQCDGGTIEGTLDVCNTGKADLVVDAVSSDDAQFTVTTPSSGYPVVISPDFCFPFEVEFDSDGSPGDQSATLTVANNDPVNPALEIDVQASAGASEPNIVTTIQPSGNFGLVCLGDQKDLDLTIHNSGGCPLSVTSITSSDAEFIVGSVDDYPLVVASGDSVLVPVRFEPTDGFGAEGATFTVFSDDPDDPSHEVAASGTVEPGDINVPAATAPVDFGNVCADATATVDIPVCNTGLCNLNVASASIDCDDFTIVANPFPTPVSPDFCIPLTVAYTPTEVGTHQCTLTIVSDDPDENPVNVTLRATTPAAVIDVPPDQAFLPEVVQSVDSCSSSRLFPISNNGLCPLTITDVAITTNPDEYALDGLPSFPIPVQTGHLLGSGDLSVVFAPDEPLDRDKLGEVSVTYVSDAVTGDTTTVVRNLCGEGVLTGARVLVTYGGTPVDEVERLQIQRINANRNRRPQLDTVDIQQRLPLMTVSPASPCPELQYHAEFGTVANPVQLLPGVYQVNATIRIDGRRYTKSVGFSVAACDFNPTVIVTF